MISVSGFILGSPVRGENLAKDISQVIPVSAEFVGDTIQGVVSARTITGVLGIFGLLAAATAVFGAIRKGVNAAWGIRRPRPFLHERLIDFLLALGAGLLFIVSVSFSAILGFFKEITALIYPSSAVNGDFVWDQVAQVIPALITLLIFVLLYRFLPNTKVRFRDVWWGALGAGVSFELTKMAFVWYVRTFPVYNVVYGTIGAVVALLTWVYISAIIFLFGALVTSRYAAYRASRRAEESAIQALWSEISRVRLTTAESYEHR
jgi:membrane protein